jgi:probable F420-dependent oxidoreductase
MRVGAVIPNAGPLPGRLGLVEMAVAAEEAGAESVWVSDHLLMVDADTTDYPFSEDGRPTWPVDTPYLEAMTSCAFIAAATRRCRVGTAVLVLPQRHVLEFAKTAATLDVLSGGRLVLGVGAGWYRDEFEALGFSYERRGRRLGEMLQVLRSCWTGRPEPFEGEEVRVPPGVVLEPTPRQPAGPPLLVGGTSAAALRRAAVHADGWLGIAWVGRLDLDGLAAQLETLRERRSEEGLPPAVATLKLHAAPEVADEIPAALESLRPLRFDEVIVEPPWPHGIDAAQATIRRACAVGR